MFMGLALVHFQKYWLLRDFNFKIQVPLSFHCMKFNPVLKDRLGSSIGLEAQYIDIQIAEAVMIDLLKDDIVILPIHDSFIVPAGYQQWLETAMNYHFKQRLGADIKVEAEVVKINDHFGWKKDHLVQRRKTFLYVAVYAKIFEIAEK